MRGETDRGKLERFMAALGERVRTEGAVYLTGGATAVLYGWRNATIDVDIKPDPEPEGLFEAIATLKEELDINVELASPDHFIPPPSGWRERSILVARYGRITFRHFDPYAQVLSKLQRRHERDLRDAWSFVRQGLVQAVELRAMFDEIEPRLARYPAIDPASYRAAVMQFCDEVERSRV